MNRPLSALPGYASAPRPSGDRDSGLQVALDTLVSQVDLFLPMALLVVIGITVWLTPDVSRARRVRLWPWRR